MLPVALLSSVSLVLSACGDGGSAGGGDSVEVAAAFYPLAFVAERVGGDHAEVTSLTSPGGEPHDLELGIAETALVGEADLVVYLADFQPAVDDAVSQNAGGSTIDVADTVQLRAIEDHSEEGHTDSHGEDDHAEEDEHTEEDEHGGEDEHAHGDLDPHFWLDPLLMADLGDVVAAQLGEIDPDHADAYTANAEALREDLTAVDDDYTSGLQQCERDLVVVSHDAFAYLSRYGLHFEPIAGLSPDAEPSPADLAELNQLIKREGITTVFSETLISPKLADTLAREAGVESAVLDPIEGLSDETEDEDYLSLMRSNLSALQAANGC